MTVRTLDPATLPRSDIYAQLSISSGSRLVHLSGQVARDADGGPIGEGDLAAQTAQAFRNVAAALDAVEATFDDVAKLTVYVVDWRPEKMAQLGAGLQEVAGELRGDPRRPITLIGVSALGEPDLLIEIEAVAVLD